LAEKDGVSIMDGTDEGVFAWITANYLLEGLKDDSVTFAVLDLGGASTQIVFKPIYEGHIESLLEGEHNYHLSFAGSNHTLYQHSYLNYGLMAARKSVHRLVHFMASITNKGPEPGPEIANPCISQGTSKTLTLALEGDDTTTVMMSGNEVGNFEGCRRLIELVMAKDAVCQVKPCSFNGVYQPSLLDTFPSGKVLLLSYFYDRLSPLLPSPSSPDKLMSLPISKIADLAREVCKGPEVWSRYFGSNKRAVEELSDRPEHCLDLTFMYTLLRLGYEFEDTREVFIAKQVEGTELGWALGAGIALADAKLECIA